MAASAIAAAFARLKREKRAGFMPYIVAGDPTLAATRRLLPALEAAGGARVPPPMYALCWPGSRALARLVLTGRVAVAGRRVLDAGCGSGVAATAAAVRGGVVTAADLDALAVWAAAEVARRHGVALATTREDVLAAGAAAGRWDTVLAGDLVYDAASAAQVEGAVARWRSQGAEVWLSDGGRPFFTPAGLTCRWEGWLPVARGVEGAGQRRVRVFGPPGPAWDP